MTRTYEFYCESCSFEFSKDYDWDKIKHLKPRCPNCLKETVYRNYLAEKVIVDDCTPKTLGALADLQSKVKNIDIK